MLLVSVTIVVVFKVTTVVFQSVSSFVYIILVEPTVLNCLIPQSIQNNFNTYPSLYIFLIGSLYHSNVLAVSFLYTTADYVCSNKEYSTLCGALKKYELADTLQDGAWTLFAPSNEAFEGLSSSYADDYLEILKFHVLKETVMYDDLICMNKVETVLGQNSRTKCSAKGKVQTGAGNLVVGTIPMITDPDIKGCNGIIQGIDEVMLPKLKSTMVIDDGSEDTPIGGNLFKTFP